MDPDTEMGPLVSREHREKVLSYFALAREEGATVVAGGGVPVFGDARDEGAYVQPTIWTGLPETARCIKEEVFGPVCHVAPFDTEEEAIRLANDTRYGLAAVLYTRDGGRALRMARGLQSGSVAINTGLRTSFDAPFGGYKQSGIGKERGLEAIYENTQLKNIKYDTTI